MCSPTFWTEPYHMSKDLLLDVRQQTQVQALTLTFFREY